MNINMGYQNNKIFLYLLQFKTLGQWGYKARDIRDMKKGIIREWYLYSKHCVHNFCCKVRSTGLPTKDVTSINHCYNKICAKCNIFLTELTFVIFLLNIYKKMTKTPLNSLYFRRSRFSRKSYLLWLTLYRTMLDGV